MSSTKQKVDALKAQMERLHATSRDEVVARVRERLAEGMTLEEIVTLTFSESYWRGALDATELDVSEPPAEVAEAVS